MKKILATLTLIALTTSVVRAGDFTEVEDFPDSIYYGGKVEIGDEEKFAEILMSRDNAGVTTKYLVLDSPGGYMQPSAFMSMLIRAREISTVVPTEGMCASACMLMFAAGTDRYAWEGSHLGVHNVSTEEGDDGVGTVLLSKEMSAYGTPASVIGKLAITPHEEMSWLEQSDLEGWATTLSPESE